MRKYSSVLLALSTVFLGAVTSNAAYELSPVYVVAKQNLNEDRVAGDFVNSTSRLGILGKSDLTDIPYSAMSISSKTLDYFNDASQPLCNVLTHDPSIRSSTSSPMYTDFSMRGIGMNGNHVMLNGVPVYFINLLPRQRMLLSLLKSHPDLMLELMVLVCQIMVQIVGRHQLRVL